MKEKEPQKQEQKSEAPPILPEKKESIIDTNYHSAVQKYFNRRKKEFEGGENPDEDVLQYEQFIHEQQTSLSKIANKKMLEKTQPKDVSFAVSELTGMMTSYNPDYHPQDPDSLIDYEKEHLEAKKLFIETCKKIFPEIQPKEAQNGLFVELKKLEKLGVSTFGLTISKFTELLNNNPGELRRYIDDILEFAGDLMKKRAFNGFNEKDLEDRNTAEKELGTAMLPVYKLQLLRDQLTEKIYGKDKTPSETREIDKARESLK